MDRSKFWCVLWNPTRRNIQRERLDHYIESVHRGLHQGFDSRDAEVVLEISDSSEELDELLKKWADILLPR